MSLTVKAFAIPALISGALLLSACDGMVDNEKLVEEFASSCSSSFAEEGGPAELADPFCECSTAQVRERELGVMDMVDQEIMTSIGEECMTQVLAENENFELNTSSEE